MKNDFRLKKDFINPDISFGKDKFLLHVHYINVLDLNSILCLGFIII